MALAERFDRTLINTLSMALLLSGIALAGWGLLILVAQCAGWLKFGDWQSVPLYALWLSPAEQFNQLVPLSLFDSSWGPLDLAPSFGNYSSINHLSSTIAGAMVGVEQICDRLLSTPLSLALVLVGFLGFACSCVMSRSHLS